MKNILSTLLGLMLLVCVKAQSKDTVPTLRGKIAISITKGTFECDLYLKDIPRAKDYFIRINSGMNLRYFKNQRLNYHIYFEKSDRDTMSSGESSAYYFPDNTGKAKFLPDSLHIRYVGMFPVISDTVSEYSRQDWRGNIAFNGYSVRADGLQSAWYPILYDIKRDIRYNKVKYDLDVECGDCSAIYLNGSLPVRGTKAHFKSDVPQELTLFAGRFKIANVGSTYFLNPDLNDLQLKLFGDMTNSYKAYYEKNIHIPYQQNITYIQTTPTSKTNSWLFVSYPTIINIGFGANGMKSFFDTQTGDWFKPYMAHELGHYYFGELKTFNSELGDMMREGFAEYLSLKVAKTLIQDSIYNNKIKEKIQALKNFKPISFARVRSKADYQDRELYVYYYAPLILVAMEKELGEATMWKWMQAIIETPADFTNYNFLQLTLGLVLGDMNKLIQIRSKYFDTDESLENAIKTIGGK